MNKKQIINQIKKLVKEKIGNENSGHDYWHSYRVAKTAVNIGKIEKADLLVLEIAAWLHDIEHDVNNDHEIRSAFFAEKYLYKMKLDPVKISQITACIKHHRFSKNKKVTILEEKIIQDADKLDALGAIGIARLYQVASKYRQILYDPAIKTDFKYYLKMGRSTTTINHFYDKLFKLKKLLHTRSARTIAKKREELMRNYLKHFLLEWEGKS